MQGPLRKLNTPGSPVLDPKASKLNPKPRIRNAQSFQAFQTSLPYQPESRPFNKGAFITMIMCRSVAGSVRSL